MYRQINPLVIVSIQIEGRWVREVSQFFEGYGMRSPSSDIFASNIGRWLGRANGWL